MREEKLGLGLGKVEVRLGEILIELEGVEVGLEKVWIVLGEVEVGLEGIYKDWENEPWWRRRKTV